MQNNDRLTPMEKELEAALGGLKPAGAALGRDQVMFGAGQASMHRRSHLWQGVCVCLVGALLISLVTRPGPATGPERRAETVAYEPPAPLPAFAPVEPIDRQEVEAFRRYVRTRQAVLSRGIEAIPALPASRDGFDAPLSRADMGDLLL